MLPIASIDDPLSCACEPNPARPCPTVLVFGLLEPATPEPEPEPEPEPPSLARSPVLVSLRRVAQRAEEGGAEGEAARRQTPSDSDGQPEAAATHGKAR
jgi:hypothetical protein